MEHEESREGLKQRTPIFGLAALTSSLSYHSKKMSVNPVKKKANTVDEISRDELIILVCLSSFLSSITFFVS
jgi:hypothetical protein